jgi:hypothetical protein
MTDDSQRFAAVEPAGREEILCLCEEMMKEAHSKVAGSSRIRDTDYAKARQGYMNAFSSLMNSYRLMHKDQELEEMSEELQNLKEDRPWEIHS